MDLAWELKALLLENGASLVGYADMSDFPQFGYARGVSIAVAHKPEVVRMIPNGPCQEYKDDLARCGAKLEELALLAADFLTRNGYRAVARTNSVVVVKERRADLPHKAVAIRAGLGWIGKHNLLVTPEYGSAVRLIAVLTDAPLPAAQRMENGCGDCHICRDACPGGALYGTLWVPGTDRDAMVDTAKCSETQQKRAIEALGTPGGGCGVCFARCRQTQSYLERAGV